MLLLSWRLLRECHLLICLERLPITPQLRSAIKRHLDYPRCKTLNCWCSVDVYFQDGAGSVSLRLLPIKEANTSFMTVCNRLPLRLPKMQYQQLLTLHWRSFPGWGREHVSPLFDYKGGQYIQKEQWHTILNIWRLTVGYLNVTINRTTWNAEQQIGPDGSIETWQNRLVDGSGSMFGLLRSCGSGFCMGLDPNRSVFAVWTEKPGRFRIPVGNTTLNLILSSVLIIG